MIYSKGIIFIILFSTIENQRGHTRIAAVHVGGIYPLTLSFSL